MYKQDILKEIKRVNKQHQLILKQGTMIGKFGNHFGILSLDDKKLFLELQPESFVKHICKDFKEYIAKFGIDVDDPKNNKNVVETLFDIYHNGYSKGFAHQSDFYLGLMMGTESLEITREESIKKINSLIETIQSKDLIENAKFWAATTDNQRKMCLMLLRDSIRNGCNAATKIASKRLGIPVENVSPDEGK